MADGPTPTAFQVSGCRSFNQIAHDKVSGSASRWIQILAITLFLLSASVFMALALTSRKFDSSILRGGFRIGFREAAAGLAAFPATIVLHELLHGLAMRIFGARPEYGVLPQQLMFYASAPGYAFRRNTCLVVEMAPLMVLIISSINPYAASPDPLLPITPPYGS